MEFFWDGWRRRLSFVFNTRAAILSVAPHIIVSSQDVTAYKCCLKIKIAYNRVYHVDFVILWLHHAAVQCILSPPCLGTNQITIPNKRETKSFIDRDIREKYETMRCNNNNNASNRIKKYNYHFLFIYLLISLTVMAKLYRL